MTIYECFLEACIRMRDQAIEHDSEIISIDDGKSLLVGWMVEKTEETFYLRPVQIRNRSVFLNLHSIPFMANFVELAQMLIASTVGRNTIAKMLSARADNDLIVAIDHFTRASKLKAFW